MKMRKLIIAALAALAFVAFFLPCKSYYPALFWKSDHLVRERIIDILTGNYSVINVLCMLLVFAPAIGLMVQNTRVTGSIIVLLIISLLSSFLLLGADFILRFGIFEADVKLLSGYFLFMPLAGLGCLIFWSMTFRRIWIRIQQRRQRLRAAY